MRFMYPWTQCGSFVILNFTLLIFSNQKTMLFRANQMPPVLSNNSSLIGQSMPPSTNNSINSMGMANHSNHFPVSQDVDLRSMGMGNQSTIFPPLHNQLSFRKEMKLIPNVFLL